MLLMNFWSCVCQPDSHDSRSNKVLSPIWKTEVSQSEVVEQNNSGSDEVLSSIWNTEVSQPEVEEHNALDVNQGTETSLLCLGC